ncbi:MFS transporter [Thermoactinospora rubra]|uniref:MFS transporter n=1 Tax=Thermoactinospora rubra TaxID=1088767 RepID=UPI000A106045|nr:MFS transporter [Thermoactinospora rubra]
MTARRALSRAQLAASIGDGAYLVTSALYFARVIGLSPSQIGLGLTMGWAVGAVAGIPLGHLADRRGPRGAAVLLALVTAGAVASFLLIRSFPLFVAAICVYAAAQTGLTAARQALLAGLVEPDRRTEVRARLQSVLNAGLALGAGLGGLALYAGTPQVYLAVLALDALCFVACALMLLRLPAVAPVGGPPLGDPPLGGPPRLVVLRDRPYALVTLINAVMLLYMPLFSLVIPLWIAQRTVAPPWIVAVLLVGNTLAVVLFQVRVARRVRDLPSAVRSVRQAGLVMLAACAVFALSAFGGPVAVSVALLAVATALQVLAEMMTASGAWELSFRLAPDGRQGQYQGFFAAGVPLARMIGPALLTTLVLGGGVPGWLLLGCLFALAGASTGPAVRLARPRLAAAGHATPTGKTG